MPDIDLEILRNSPLGAGFDDEEVESLAGFFHQRDMGAGMTVFIENMPGESLYLIQKGEVEISKMLAEGDEQPLVRLGEKEVFGELAILDGHPRSATARVTEAVSLSVITRPEYERLCNEVPALALKFTLNIVRLFCGRIQKTNDEYKDLLLHALGRK